MAASPLMHTLTQLVLSFEDAHAHLLGCLHEHAEATATVTCLRAVLERSKARLTAEGLEGKNAETREARLHLDTAAELDALLEAEQVQALARLELDSARLAWDALRYRLRALECVRDLQEY